MLYCHYTVLNISVTSLTETMFCSLVFSYIRIRKKSTVIWKSEMANFYYFL